MVMPLVMMYSKIANYGNAVGADVQGTITAITTVL